MPRESGSAETMENDIAAALQMNGPDVADEADGGWMLDQWIIVATYVRVEGDEKMIMHHRPDSVPLWTAKGILDHALGMLSDG